MNTKRACVRCGGSGLVTDSEAGEVFCRRCGCIAADRMAECRLPPHDGPAGRGSRTPLSIHDRGLAGVMGLADWNGRRVPASNTASVRKMRALDGQAVAGGRAAPNYRTAFTAIDGMAKKMAIGSAAAEGAAYIYRKAHGRRISNGRSIRALAAAAVYASCRQLRIPVMLRDVADACDERPRTVAKCYRLVRTGLGLDVPVTDPASCVSRVAGAAGLSEWEARAAVRIIRRAAEDGVTAGKHPMVMAANALYAAAVHGGSNVSRCRISRAAGITSIAMRNNEAAMRDVAEAVLGGEAGAGA